MTDRVAKIRIDFLVAETFERLFGTTAFMEAVDKAIPDVERQERRALKALAEAENWDFGDFDVERQILDEKFGHWIPTLAAYSLIILLNSAVETELNAFAERVGDMRGSNFRVHDINGRGIERAALYLKRVATLPIMEDPAWTHLHNLQKLRNVIVHSGGRWTGPAKERDRLLAAYPGDLRFPDGNGTRREMWISMHLCRAFAQQTEEFFKRMFKMAGLPENGVQIVP